MALDTIKDLIFGEKILFELLSVLPLQIVLNSSHDCYVVVLHCRNLWKVIAIAIIVMLKKLDLCARLNVDAAFATSMSASSPQLTCNYFERSRFLSLSLKRFNIDFLCSMCLWMNLLSFW